ncbi:MAG: HipA domain-containing protein [Bacilli bacterium]|nr:HipA domain-containing protein [Bacilli bacterium]
MVIDYSSCRLSGIRYGGSERKIGIVNNGVKYMLKIQSRTQFGRRNNHISEYIGSHIFELIGIDVHETQLGTYKGENVVACRDFVLDDTFFIPFNAVGESTIETDVEHYQYSYEDILVLLKRNIKITDVEEAIDIFFRVFIVDALIGNFDRHGANWGFIKKGNSYSLAPVFDNGSCLYPQMVDENEMLYVLSNEEEINDRVYKYPTSQIKINGKKSSYYEVISSLSFEKCNEQLKWVMDRLNMDRIYNFIDGISCISDIQKSFYKTMLKHRYEKILLSSYEKLIGGMKDE